MKDRIGKLGLVIFDGSCGACSAFIGEKSSFFRKYGFEVAALQEEWVPKLTGLSQETLLQAIHLYTTEGQLLRGLDFFQYLASKVWWLTPVSLLLNVSILRPVFVKLYDLIANRRRNISKMCGLQSRAIYK